MVRGKAPSVSRRTDEEQPLVAERLTRVGLICVSLSAGDSSGWEHRGRGGRGGRARAGRRAQTPLNAPAHLSILWILHRLSTQFVSRRERRNSKSSLCHKEGLPSAWIRYQLLELAVYLCTCQRVNVALMLFQTDVKGAHGHTPSKGSKVASLHTFQYLHTFKPSG